MSIKFTISNQVPISGEVSLAAVQSVPLTPDNSIMVISYHDDYPANLDDSVYDASTTGLPYIAYTSADGPRNYQVVVTDKVMYTDDTTRDTILLPYQYQLRYDHYEYSTNPGGSILICYENGDIVPGAKYRLEMCDTTMWTDYRDNGSGMTHRYDRSLTWAALTVTSAAVRIRILLSEALCFTNQTYYVRYNKVFRRGSGALDLSTDVIENHMEIINPELLYTYDDDYTFDDSDNSIDIAGGGLLPATGVYCKRSDINRLRVLSAKSNYREGWFCRVWCGGFEDADDNLYYAPEVFLQPAAVDWASVGNAIIDPRCSFVSYDRATIVSPYKIKVNEFPLYFTTSNYPDYTPYWIYDGFHNTGVTDVDSESNSNKGMSVYVNDVAISGQLISDWDAWNGTIKLSTSLNPDDDVNVSYLYRQLYYTMQVPDMNPQVHHYIPGPAGSTDQGYLPMDDSIVVAIMPDDSDTELINWYPRTTNPNCTHDGTYDGYSSIMPASYSGTPTVSLISDTIKLADISYTTTTPSINTTVYDTRMRGGGIIEDNYIKVSRNVEMSREDIQEESNYYADIGLYDGQGLKKDGVLIITIPIAKLNEIKSNIMAEVYNISEAEAYQQAISTVRGIIESNASSGAYYVIVDSDGNLWPNVLPRRTGGVISE